MEANALSGEYKNREQRIEALLSHYDLAKQWMERSAYRTELEWQRSQDFNAVSETEFLREYAWVVLNSGFRESTVRKHFNYISLCFCDWESASVIVANSEVCCDSASTAFRNQRKLQAIVDVARSIDQTGYNEFWSSVKADPLGKLKSLPFLADITSRHLAKNLGLEFAKPDRHLVRVAQRFGFDDVTIMCEQIKTRTGDPLSVSDIILWRFEEQIASSRRCAA